MGSLFAFVMDPMTTVQPLADTSFAFMEAAQARGHQAVHVNPAEVTYRGGEVWLHGTLVRVDREGAPCYEILSKKWLPAKECQAIFIRTDPPFDEAYLNLSWLLSFAEDSGVRIVNSPRGLREANEHLYGLYFPELSPATLVGSDQKQVLEFVREHGGLAIAKPIDGHAGFGVVQLAEGDPNIHAIIDMLTLEGKQPILAQAFVKSEIPGDKRLLMVDGELRGVVRRIPPKTDFRGNIHIGGHAEACEITEADRSIEQAMQKRLRKDGLFFVGIDVIEDKLIEVNVTSPTLIQELKALGGVDVAMEVIERLEA